MLDYRNFGCAPDHTFKWQHFSARKNQKFKNSFFYSIIEKEREEGRLILSSRPLYHLSLLGKRVSTTSRGIDSERLCGEFL